MDFRKQYTKHIKENVYNFAVAGDIDQENPVNPDNAKEIQDILRKKGVRAEVTPSEKRYNEVWIKTSFSRSYIRKILDKEGITESADQNTKFVKQSGGRGQYAHVVISIEPNEQGEGYEFINKIVGGAIPKEYIPAIDKGIQESMKNGALAGYPVDDLTVTLTSGSFHDVDSNEMCFRVAGGIAIKEAMLKAKPKLIEPIMALEVVMPEDYLGTVMGDVTSRRGTVKGFNPRGNAQILNATVPLSEMFGYATDLRSMTQGRAVFTLQFAHYAKAPNFIVEQISESLQGKITV